MENLGRLTPSISMLQAFEAAARNLSFTRAADELAVTQGAISRQIQALEGLLDLQLFHRSGRHFTLTDVGRRYALDIAPALARIRGASARALAFRGTGGHLHVAVLPTFASRWLLPRLSRFYQLHPSSIVHLHSRAGEFSLDEAGIDAGIAVGVEPFTGVVSHPLVEEQMVIIASPTLLLLHPVETGHDLLSHRLLHVMMRSEAWREWAMRQGLKTQNKLDGPQFETSLHLIQAAVAGIGVGLVARCLVEEEVANGSLVEVALPALPSERKFCLLYPPDKAELPVLVQWREWLMAEAQQPCMVKRP